MCHAGVASMKRSVKILFLVMNTYISYLGHTRDEYLGREGGRVAVALAEGVLDHVGEQHKVPPNISEVHCCSTETARSLSCTTRTTNLLPLSPGALHTVLQQQQESHALLLVIPP